MPYIYKNVKKTVEEVQAMECSRCKKIVDGEDFLELQETLNYRNVGGYGSVWGDGAVVEFDLCQYCVFELVKDFATLHESDY